MTVVNECNKLVVFGLPTFLEATNDQSIRTSFLVHPDLRHVLDMMGRWALVGGAVRDAAIGKAPRDLDIMVWSDCAGMVSGLGDLPDAQWRAYPSRHRVTTAGLTQEMINLDLGVKIHKTDIWSALDPRWSGLPDRWDCFDFSINSAGIWNDGSFSCHDMFFHDIEHKLLRPCRSPVQAYRLNKVTCWLHIRWRFNRLHRGLR